MIAIVSASHSCLYVATLHTIYPFTYVYTSSNSSWNATVVVHLAIPCVSVCMTASSAAEFAAAVGALLDKAVYLFRTQGRGSEKKKCFVCGRNIGPKASTQAASITHRKSSFWRSTSVISFDASPKSMKCVTSALLAKLVSS